MKTVAATESTSRQDPTELVVEKRRDRLPHFLLRPYGIVIASVGASAVAWALPDWGVRRGFVIREPLTLEGMLLLSLWYGLIVILSAGGFRAGRNVPLFRGRKGSLSLDRLQPYRVISVLAWIGVGAAYFHIIEVIGMAGIVSAIARTTVNDLKDALYTDYSIGLYSLRYVAAVAGGVALFRFLERGRTAPIDILNFAALVGTSAISSRLSLIWALIIGLSLWGTSGKIALRAARWRIAALAISVVVVLWSLNYSRNATYYARRGTESFVMAGVGEIRAYLGTPFQVALGVANHMDAALKGAQSDSYVEWEVNLNSNSAFDQLIPRMGLLAFAYIGATAFVYSLLAGMLAGLRGTYLFLGYPVILYAFAELWRIDLFRQGIFYTNMFAAVGVPLILYMFQRQRSKYSIKLVHPERHAGAALD
jgi:hypothetical protein